jgi:Phosphotransferase enzyme family
MERHRPAIATTCTAHDQRRTPSGQGAADGPSPPDEDLERLRSRARAVGIVVGEVIHHTDKAIVATGWHHDGRPVVLKLLTCTDPYWTQRHSHEIDMYRLFDNDPPPLRIPRLVHHDGQGLMVLTHLPGTRVHEARHVVTDLTTATVDAIMATVNAVPTWRPHTPPAPLIVDYHARADDEHAMGLIDDGARSAIHRMLGRWGRAREIQHGDPLPANLLMHPHGCGLIDWEHTGTYLPGWDLAILDTVAGAASPTLRAAIEATVTERRIWDPYRVNLALAIAREIRIHRSLPVTDPLRAGRLAALDIAWRRVRELLRRGSMR